MDQQATRLEELEPGTYVVAVSGGIDSVVLLDMLARQSQLNLIMAHFDHGIRQDSHEDAEFVKELAAHHGLKYESRREELGEKASEEEARTQRYLFLRGVAKNYNARLITAHHADDIIETIAINLTRGTGWRGLAVLDSDIIRPLLPFFKKEIKHYAQIHGLMWHEDSTNTSDAYLRNRIRRKLETIDVDSKRQLLGLWSQQKATKRDIEKETTTLITDTIFHRYFFTHIDERSALELLRHITHGALTRPQLQAVWLAIKTARPNSTFQAGSGVEFDFTSRNFTLKLIK